MKIKNMDNDTPSSEISFLIGMMCNQKFLENVNVNAKEHFSKHTESHIREIGMWCVEWFDKYRTPIGNNIVNVFEEKSRKLSPPLCDSISDMLERLKEAGDDAGSDVNPEYMKDSFFRYIKECELRNLVSKVESQLSMGDADKAEATVARFSLTSTVTNTGVDAFDKDALLTIFSEEETTENLMDFKGALGQMLNRDMKRDCFVAFLAPEKRGKTWVLLECAYNAYFQARKNVAYFSVGDMSIKQIQRRLAIRITGKPLGVECVTGYHPVLDCIHNRNGSCDDAFNTVPVDVDLDMNITSQMDKFPKGYRPCRKCKRTTKMSPCYHMSHFSENPASWNEVMRGVERVEARTRSRRLKISAFPNSTANTRKLEEVLDVWERNEGFVPDVIVTDYADIMAPEEGASKEYRHQQNETWKALRALSQKRHCLCITATQADAPAQDTRKMTARNFSEDKRKNAHVTGLYAIDQTADEKVDGIWRISPLLVREHSLSPSVVVGHNLSTGQPHLFSFFEKSFKKFQKK